MPNLRRPSPTANATVRSIGLLGAVVAFTLMGQRVSVADDAQNTNVQAAQSTGGGVSGTVGGAAGGAAIGAIAGDAGAAIGATVGLLHGVRSQQKANAQAQQQAAQQTATNQQAQINTFKRAMTACLESRNHSVK